jgi:hypothetical protein
MREHGYEIINPKGSAQAGGVFTLDAVWDPARADNKQTMQIASRAMTEYKGTLRTLAK